MSWFSPKSKKEDQPQEEIQVTLLCMKCREKFTVMVSLTLVQTASGLCPCCRTVVEWMMPPQGERYLEFLTLNAAMTRRQWIVRP